MLTICPFTFQVILLKTEFEFKKKIIVKQKIDALSIYLTSYARKAAPSWSNIIYIPCGIHENTILLHKKLHNVKMLAKIK